MDIFLLYAILIELKKYKLENLQNGNFANEILTIFGLVKPAESNFTWS